MNTYPLSLYRDLFEKANEGIILSDKNEKVREANPAAVKIFGYGSKKELLECSISDLVPQEKREKHQENVHSYHLNPSERKMGKGRDIEGVRKDGSVLPIEVSLNHYTLENGEKLVISFIVDISERVNAQRHTEEMLSEALESERERLAKELHDGITQLLTGIHMNLGGLSEHEDPELIKRLSGLTDEAIQEARALTQNLMPPDLYDKGPFLAIEKMLERVEATYGIRTEFIAPEKEERHCSFLEVTLFRICQECISNVIKHANASSLQVRIKKKGDEGLELRVEDDGSGYDRSKIDREEKNDGSGMGLGNIQERIRTFDGDLKIRSEPGKGTIIQGFLPFRTRKAYQE